MSSLRQKKRDVNRTRKKTKKRLNDMLSRTLINDGNVELSEYQNGLKKRKTLYAHERNTVDTKTSGNNESIHKEDTDNADINSFKTPINHVFYPRDTDNECIITLIAEVNKIRENYSTKRCRAKSIIFTKYTKHAKKLASNLGWGDKRSKVSTKIKKQNGIRGGRETILKGVGIIADFQTKSENKQVTQNFKSGKFHTIIITMKDYQTHLESHISSVCGVFNLGLPDSLTQYTARLRYIKTTTADEKCGGQMITCYASNGSTTDTKITNALILSDIKEKFEHEIVTKSDL